MTATLSTIDTALFAALALGQHTGTPTSTEPFALVGRFAGEVSEQGIQEACAQYPSAFLRYDGGASTRTVDAVEGTEDAGLESWTVLVCLEEPRAVDEATQGSSPLTPGFLPLIESVLPAGVTLRPLPDRALLALPLHHALGLGLAHASQPKLQEGVDL